MGQVDGVEYAVTGETANSEDFNSAQTKSMPLVFGFVLLFAFGLLLVTFRSIVIAVKAILLNLLSVAAAYGALVAIFQWGWGEGLLGFQSNGGIANWLPMFMFVILFGLSMDYHVFILSRIREGYDRGMSTDNAISHGIKSTAGTVTSAAFVMVGVFLVFVTLPLVDLKEMGIGLALAVLIDATLVRGVLLPATMKLLGERNWYLPSWLKWLPNAGAHEPQRAGLRPGRPPRGRLARTSPTHRPRPRTREAGARPIHATTKGNAMTLSSSTPHRPRRLRRPPREELRESPGRPGRQLHGAARNDRGLPRPERCRQDDDAPGAARTRRAHVGHGALRHHPLPRPARAEPARRRPPGCSRRASGADGDRPSLRARRSTRDPEIARPRGARPGRAGGCRETPHRRLLAGHAPAPRPRRRAARRARDPCPGRASNGLDPDGIRWLRHTLRDFAAAGGTVLLSSHVLAEVAQTVEEIVVIGEGRVLAHAPVGDFTSGLARQGDAGPDAVRRVADRRAGSTPVTATSGSSATSCASTAPPRRSSAGSLPPPEPSSTS